MISIVWPACFTPSGLCTQAMVADSPELQAHLVELLVKYTDLQESARYSKLYAVPRERLPFEVWDTQQDLPPAEW